MLTKTLRQMLAVTTLLASPALAQTVPVPTKDGIDGHTPAGQNDPIWLNQQMRFFGGKADLANTTAQVPSLAALVALPAGQFGTVYRAGYATPGDGGSALYRWQAAACAHADGGSQVAPGAGTGCWVADLSMVRVTPMLFGAAGSGTADDTSAVQAALTATAAAGVPLYVADGVHLYLVSAALTSAAVVDIEGYAPVGNDGINNAQACPSGLIVTSDINLLLLTGPKAKVHDVCIQMAPPGVSRGAGTAILLGGADQQADDVSGNTIFRPYDGIGFGSAVGALVRNSAARDNIIRDPTRYGIPVGMGTAGGVTANITLVNNEVGCDAGINPDGIGVAIFDGSVAYDGTNIGPNNCKIGTIIAPGTVNGVGQNVNGSFRGVVGDSPGTHYTGADTVYALYANPSTSLGVIEWLSFVDVWAAGAGGPTSEEQMYFGNTNGGQCSNVKVTGSTIHSTSSQTGHLIDLGGCDNVVLSGNEIDAWSGGTVTGDGINVGATTSHYAITGNHIGKEGGATLAIGIGIASPTGFGIVAGNDLSEAVRPIAYSSVDPGTDRLVIGDNEGVTDTCPSVASAATITLADVSPCYHVTGTTTVTSMLNPYNNRRVTLFVDNGLSFATGGSSYGMCASNLTVAAAGAAVFLWNVANMCWAHVP